MSPPLTRRRVLAFGVAAGTTTFAGCSALVGPSVELGYGFAISNSARDAITVHVEISGDGTTQYDAEHNIGAAVYDSRDDYYPTRASGTRVELGDWATDAAGYTVRATLDDGTSAETNLAEGWSEDCVIPEIYVPPLGPRLGEVEIVRYHCDMWAENSPAPTEDES